MTANSQNQGQARQSGKNPAATSKQLHPKPGEKRNPREDISNKTKKPAARAEHDSSEDDPSDSE